MGSTHGPWRWRQGGIMTFADVSSIEPRSPIRQPALRLSAGRVGGWRHCAYGVLAWLSLSVPAVQADFEAGMNAFQEQRYASAIHEWRDPAERGDPEAQFALGRMYEQGLGARENLEEAGKWFRLAAESGNTLAQVRLGQLYLAGRLEGKPEDAVQWLSQAAEAGDDVAQFQLGLLYLEGSGVPVDEREAARWLEVAAEQGHTEAQNNIGSLYEAGRGVVQSDTRAIEWYEKAALQGDSLAQNNLGAMHARGRGTERNHAWAVFWFAMSAQAGNQQARDNLETSLEHLEARAIAGSRVNIRAAAGTDSQILTTMDRGEGVKELGSVDGWSQIYLEIEGAPTLGWVSSNLLD